MTYSTITIEIEDRIAILTFNRPALLNAFSSVLVREVGDAMEALATDDAVKVIVVRGEGRAFSAGFDLKENAASAGERSLDVWRAVLESDYRFIMSFWNCPKPTIAAVHGYCIGGAFELSLACDVTIAATGTRFGSPEVKFGSGAVALLLPWIAGPKAAKELLLTGDDKLTADRALQLGIVNRVVPDGEAFDTAMAMARDMAAAASAASRMTKLAINRTYEAMGMKAALEAALEIDVLIEAGGGDERAEFDRIRRQEGLQAALVWRNAQR